MSAIVHELVERLRSEFLEMPGLRLTSAQVQRLCGLEAGLCEAVLDALVDAKFLRKHSDGGYSRVSDGLATHQCNTRTYARLCSS